MDAVARAPELPGDFHLTLDPGTLVHGDALLGGTPFRRVNLTPRQARTIRAWRAGAPVGKDGALARALVAANLAQPVPPPTAGEAVTLVVPVRDRPVDHLRGAIVVDDGSREPVPGAAIRHATPRGAAAARNAGAALVKTPLVAFLDSDTRPRPGWLEALLPHFADPRVALVAPRIVAAAATTPLGRYEAEHSPLDRGPLPAAVVPGGRVPFVPGAAMVVRTSLARFDTALSGGEDVDLVWRLVGAGWHVRYEPAARVEHAHRTNARAWLARRAHYGRTAAPLARRHPGHARPLALSPWSAAAWLAVAARRPLAGAAITAAATTLLARELGDARLATRLAAGGTAAAGRVVADALTRSWWPLALARPRTLAAAALLPRLLDRDSPRTAALRILDDAAYGFGVWQGCFRERTLDPLLPDLGWRMRTCSADDLIRADH